MRSIKPVSRGKRALPALSCAALCFVTASCREPVESPAPAPIPANEAASSLNLQLLIDHHIAAPTIELYEREFGVSVEIATDPQEAVDVVWSANPYDMVKRARAGVLAPLESESLADWPAPWRDDEGRWFAFAARGRVAVFNTNVIPESGAPAQVVDLLDPRFTNKVAMAHPRSPATSAYLGALLHIWGEEVFRAWLSDMQGVGVVLFEDDAAVVAAVGAGDAVVGLTDSVAVQRGLQNGLPLGMRLIGHTNSFGAAFSTADLTFDGPMVVPSAVGLGADAAHPQEARRFIEFLLSEQGERSLAEGDARLMPVRPSLRDAYPDLRLPSNAYTRKFEDFKAIEDSIERAVAIAIEVLEG